MRYNIFVSQFKFFPFEDFFSGMRFFGILIIQSNVNIHYPFKNIKIINHEKIAAN